MSIGLLQFSRGIIVSSNGIEIPNPARRMASGTNTSSLTALQTTLDLIALGVKPGDIVYNINNLFNPTTSTIASITNANNAVLSTSIFSAANQSFIIYQSASNAGITSYPTLYIGTGGTLIVETEAGDTVTLIVTVGILPIKVRRVIAGGTATVITALF